MSKNVFEEKMEKMAVPLFLSLILLTSTVGVSLDESAYKVHLKSREFYPYEKISEETLRYFTNNKGDNKGVHLMIQLYEVPDAIERERLEKMGLILLNYIPQNTWFATIKSQEVLKIEEIRWIGKIEVYDKIDPNLRYSKNSELFEIGVLFFRDVLDERIQEIIEKYGDTEFGYENFRILEVEGERIAELAMEDEIQWITGIYSYEGLNDGARRISGAELIQNPPYNLKGSGVWVGIWDEGWVDINHQDFSGRLIIGDLSSEEFLPDVHATHVAGTIAGSGALSGGAFRGIAPNAQLISFNRYNFIEELKRAKEEYGVRVANNSWGISVRDSEGVLGDYTSDCSLIDEVVRKYKVTVVWAAGNAQNFGGYNTIVPFATAKNVLSVGAVYTDEENRVCEFSSFGPTDDGRIKPEIVAPGGERGGDGGIWSTLPQNQYGGLFGTSQASPVISGSAALIYEAYRKAHGTDPLPSTIKAILLHTARDLGAPGPDYSYGFGLVSLESAARLVEESAKSNLLIEDGLSNGEQKVYNLLVLKGEKELKATLVWDDEPATVNTTYTLVNNLDLALQDPLGNLHYPWVLDPLLPSNPARKGIDDVNNVEQVLVENPTPGEWKIIVFGKNLPNTSQKFSLALSFGALESVVEDGENYLPEELEEENPEEGEDTSEEIEPEDTQEPSEVVLTHRQNTKPLAEKKISDAERVRFEAWELLQKAKALGYPVSQYESYLRRADKLLEGAKEALMDGDFTSSNNLANGALGMYREVIELLQRMLG
ncbi:MAG: S8 family serine peptidase [Candidatus Methanofastidiosia archaeon]